MEETRVLILEIVKRPLMKYFYDDKFNLFKDT